MCEFCHDIKPGIIKITPDGNTKIFRVALIEDYYNEHGRHAMEYKSQVITPKYCPKCGRRIK